MRSDPNHFLDEDDIAPGDRARGSDDDATTAAGQRRGSRLERRLAGEEPDRAGARPSEAGEIVDEDRPDDEPDLVGTIAGIEDDPLPAERDTLPAEEEAMGVRETAPGGTEDETDGYVQDQDERS